MRPLKCPPDSCVCVSVCGSVYRVYICAVVCVRETLMNEGRAAGFFSQAPGQSVKPPESEQTAF